MALANRSISDYLQEEILEQQVPAIQTFLLKTSIPNRFCTELCQALVEQTDSAWNVQACIDWLERADLLIVTKTDRRKWYTYHSLVRSFLKERLLVKYGDEVVTDLNRKSVNWFIQQGFLHEAISQASDSGDLDLTASLIEDSTLRNAQLRRPDYAESLPEHAAS